ncbi:unnamed protein product [Polarella glacialis]|uniref:Chalcone/stilbene synthase C-terminal domain-containing protein n=1 Tax=Polarella glacialis TaxID=89957 RepID=A0A813DB29_POLGL|nr:unnamed protein product [Polarella glacialis]
MDIACHTGGPRVLHEVAKAADAADEQLAASWAVMKAHGNLSGASNLSVLDYQNRVVENGRQWVLCLAMGPGVCIEGLLLQRVSSPPRITESRASDTCPEEEAIEQRVPRTLRRSNSESAARTFEAVLADVEEEEEGEQEEADGITTSHTNDTLLPPRRRARSRHAGGQAGRLPHTEALKLLGCLPSGMMGLVSVLKERNSYEADDLHAFIAF